MESGKGLSGAAVALILFLFFVPWITVSCGGSVLMTFSGFELATGKEIGFGERSPADPLLFFVPLAAIVAAAFAYGSSSLKQAGKGQIVSALVGLGTLVLKWISIQENQSPMITVSYEIGLWGTVGSFILLLIAGWVIYSESEVGSDTRSLTSVQKGRYRTCIKCMTTNSRLALVCSHCGNSLSNVSINTCSSCDQIIPTNALYCPGCNHKIIQANPDDLD